VSTSCGSGTSSPAKDANASNSCLRPLRVASAIFYRRHKEAADKSVKLWENAYEAGAWGFSALLGLLCWLTLRDTAEAALQMVVITTATAYAAAIAGRNAGRPPQAR